MSSLRCTLALLALAPALAAAQTMSVVEIGTRAGGTFINDASGTYSIFSVPGSGILAQPGVYATLFAPNHMMLEPELSASVGSGGGNTNSSVGMGISMGYLFGRPGANSPYVAATFAYQSISGTARSGDLITQNDMAAGARIGYRWVVRKVIAVRFEGLYRRWFDDHANEVAFSVGVGVLPWGG